MVLADLFLNLEWKFSIAHCNFQLRGSESDGDEDFVVNWGQKNAVKIHTKRFDLGEGSIQLSARNERYQWFEELCEQEGYNKLATAHHLNDSLETVLINLTRGTGIKGIAGIKPKSGTIIRPLLTATREEIKQYAEVKSLKWREDSSNATSNYERNFLRHEVVPLLKKLNPSLDETFKQTMDRLRLTNELVQAQVSAIKDNHLIERNGHLMLDGHWIASQNDLLLLSEILRDFGFNYATSQEVFRALGKPGKSFHSATHVVEMDRESLYIKSNSEEPIEEVILEEVGDYAFGVKKLSISLVNRKPLHTKNQFEAYLDAGKLAFPLKVRLWQKGDRFKPLGMTGTKKVSDYLIDSKVPVALKSTVAVLECQGEIAWLIGYQISDDFKVTDETNYVIKLEWK